MENPGLPLDLWRVLNGGLWHATSPSGLTGVLSVGAIQVVSGRYEGSFAKKHQAVSLFDFGSSSRDDWNQFDNWSGWFGHQQDCRVPVWLKIDRAATVARVIDASETHKLWLEDCSRMIIPGVEACHPGPISVEEIVGVLLIDRYNTSLFREIPLSESVLDQLTAFEADLPPAPPESPIVQALRASRERGRT